MNYHEFIINDIVFEYQMIFLDFNDLNILIFFQSIFESYIIINLFYLSYALLQLIGKYIKCQKLIQKAWVVDEFPLLIYCVDPEMARLFELKGVAGGISTFLIQNSAIFKGGRAQKYLFSHDLTVTYSKYTGVFRKHFPGGYSGLSPPLAIPDVDHYFAFINKKNVQT